MHFVNDEQKSQSDQKHVLCPVKLIYTRQEISPRSFVWHYLNYCSSQII